MILDHPFAHVALRDTPMDEAIADVRARSGSCAALLHAASGQITSRTCQAFSSADARVLAKHGLTRRIGQDLSGASILTASHKGREVLLELTEGVGG